MSSNLTPTSFASAAAGQSRGSRSGDGTGDWSRREGRSTNGTLTFRRPITTPSNQAPQTASDVSSALPPLVTETLPAQSPSHPTDRSLRYSRDHLLDLFQANGNESADASNLFVSGWNPTQVNGTARGWGKSLDGTVPQDPTVCWDAAGSIKPIGLQDMSAEDSEMFADINSTLKPQPQKDGGQGPGGVNGRKTSTSVSHGNGSGFNVSSPLSASRPTARRRETSDTNPFPSGAGLISPLTNRAPRDDSSWFGRKGTDQKEPQQFEEPEEDTSPSAAKASGLGTGGRSNTVGGTSSMWGTSTTAAASTAAVGAFGSFALPTVGDKRFGSTRGESRLAHLLPKQDTSETGGPGAKPSSSAAGSANAKESWRLRPRTDTDPFGEDTAPAGGASLDSSQQNANADSQTYQSFGTPMKSTGGDIGVSGLNMGSSMDNDGAASPETNPFRSPPAERGDNDHYQTAAMSSGLEKGMGAIGGGVHDHSSNFGSIRGYPGNAFDGSDRSQTSSVGAKGFTGLGSIAGWGNALNTSTPDRERTVFSSAFGSSLFSPVTGELQSPGFGGGVPGVFGPPTGGGGIGATGSLRGTSKLGSLFPPSMQAQMVGSQDQDGSLNDSVPDLRQTNPLGAIGREAIGIQGRDADMASARPGRGGFFDDLMDPTRAGGSVFASGEQGGQMLASTSSPMLQSQVYDSMSGRPSSDTPLNQPRIMVMPDRMRWVYLDPQGQTQGPFTGLEMNDWYKANFFTADLRVKKVEDTEFEPLGQLIRRIGNSREPFLVPQMGVAHGQPSLSGTFAHGDRGTVIPPLVGAFPSYGRTLTAEEQNNLERRKQEEQYMLARQREMLSVQHHPFPGGRVPPTSATSALHHHSSVHSLQSQPSFGSMTAPIGAGPPAIPGGLSGGQVFFDHPGMLPPTSLPGVSSGSDLLRDDIGAQDRQMLSGLQPTGAVPGPFATQQSTSITNEMTTRSNLPTMDQLKKDPQGFSERLKEFQKLRENIDAEDGLTGPGAPSSDAIDIAREAVAHHDPQQAPTAAAVDDAPLEHSRKAASSAESAASIMAGLSLTQQVQKAQAAKRLAEQEEVDEIVQPAEPHLDLPMPFPPPQGQAGTPIAAPTAQRSRSTLPDQYATSRSQSETPESSTVQPPPLAPWARDHVSESHKGPSLKEIQEVEAKKAAKAEEVALAARKAMAEQEAALLREREKAAATVAPGLPTSSTWAASSPTVAGSSSPWSKPGAASKPTVHGVASGSSTHSAAEKKKTLADIQREEEARKQKSKELASLSPASPAHSGTGKRYADLASKVQASTPTSQTSASASPVPAAPVGSGWATVGAGGKVKTPSGPSVSRSASTSSPAVKTAPTLPPMPRAASKQVSGAATAKLDIGGVAMEEFNKWLHRELGRGITSGIDLDGFVDSLLQLPLDLTIISEAVYASSKTMDGRHFAEEFIRRKKLAEKGVVEKQAVPLTSGDSKSSGGWNEVAKKGSSSSSSHQKEESMPAGFKMELEALVSNGRYAEVLVHEDARALLQDFVNSQLNSVGKGEAPKKHNLDAGSAALYVGIAALNAFLQSNVTGPVLESAQKVEKLLGALQDSTNGTVDGAATSLRRSCLSSLDVDGISVYQYIQHIELFCLARWVFVAHMSDDNASTLSGPRQDIDSDPAGQSLAWMRLRIHTWHYKLLTEPNQGPGSVFNKMTQWSELPSLQEQILECLDAVEKEVLDGDEQAGDNATWSRKSQVQFLLEKMNVYAMIGLDAQAQEALDAAAKRHLPQALQLNNDTLLETIDFSGAKVSNGEAAADIPGSLRDLFPDNQPPLSPLDQIILLSAATLKDAFSPADSLTLEEILPYATRVLLDKATNWQIYSQALIVRSRIEMHRSRTVERGVLQMQAVVDQVVVDTSAEAETTNDDSTVTIPAIEISTPAGDTHSNKPTSFFPAAKQSEQAPPQERLRYISMLSTPPRWHLESELAFSWAGVGSLVSALEIFKRLRLWAEVALCLASNSAFDDEGGRGSGGEEKARALIRWQLFKASDAAREPAGGEDGKDVDVLALRATDFYGPERDPAPANAPRLFCILGDIEAEPKHYERGWELSKHHYSRAKRSLGEHYLQQHDWERARDAYKDAVSVNRLNPQMWSRLGDIHLRMGVFSEAAEAFNRAIAAAGEAVGGEDARTWSNLGSALYSLYTEGIKEQPEAKRDDEEEDTGNGEAAKGKRDPAIFLLQALSAYKRGAAIARENWRIWDNVVTLASRVRPPAVGDIVIAVRNILSIRATEEAVDADVVRLLLHEAVLPKPKPAGGVPGRGTMEKAVCELVEIEIVPLITTRSELWELVTRERVWRGDLAGAIDAAEKGWRAATGGVSVGSSLGAAAVRTGGGGGSSSDEARNWLENAEAWDSVVARTDELVSILENYGPDVPTVGSRWKIKARSALRSVMSKGKDQWEGSSGWSTLEGLLEGLK
ncbi:gyf domain containing protein [Grosmannia clavigera kw1407]|uniref:Gyf domain containing protein n=1 Tax=Grosmannia clavigera (strain kw1407 / UAMH 11150) TaxID=655863 RepID=F0XIT8_GROCL|nr:gyf domain containing protein [Grosmannia clavigera kw1407]EFX02117.1 gyf domain containing protein [Grosmannia clavigera kw1407]